MSDCIFCKIANGEIPSTKLYEDENMVIIKDLNPQAPIHFCSSPKSIMPTSSRCPMPKRKLSQNASKNFLRSPINSVFPTVSVLYPTKAQTVVNLLSICTYTYWVVLNLATPCAKTALNSDKLCH